jgi:O-antigen biosynthesis protein
LENTITFSLGMELSVIIVSYNVKDFLKQCLISVTEASKDMESEIFVVDNDSKDGSAYVVKNEFPHVKLIINNTNTGFSAANNQALRLSTGRFLLLLNPDTIVENDTFSKCLDFMNSHPEAGGLGVRMVNGDGIFLPESKRALPDPLTAFFKTFGLSFLFPKSPIFSRYYLPEIENNETSLTEVISGAFMMIRKDALDLAGLLDEDYFMYGEDIDFSYRLLKTGYRNYYFTGTQITHFKGKSTDRNSISDILHFYKAMRIYVRKRYAGPASFLFRLPVISAIYLREFFAIANRIIHRIS